MSQWEETSAITQEMTSETMEETQTEDTTGDGESDIQINILDFADTGQGQDEKAAEREALYDQEAIKAYQAFLKGEESAVLYEGYEPDEIESIYKDKGWRVSLL